MSGTPCSFSSECGSFADCICGELCEDHCATECELGADGMDDDDFADEEET
jgi:hypothetical protein